MQAATTALRQFVLTVDGEPHLLAQEQHSQCRVTDHGWQGKGICSAGSPCTTLTTDVNFGIDAVHFPHPLPLPRTLCPITQSLHRITASAGAKTCILVAYGHLRAFYIRLMRADRGGAIAVCSTGAYGSRSSLVVSRMR